MAMLVLGRVLESSCTHHELVVFSHALCVCVLFLLVFPRFHRTFFQVKDSPGGGSQKTDLFNLILLFRIQAPALQKPIKRKAWVGHLKLTPT